MVAEEEKEVKALLAAGRYARDIGERY